MSFLDSLFGSAPKVSNQSSLSPQQQAIMAALQGWFTGAGAPGSGPPAYTGMTYAPLSPIQNTALGGAADFLQTLSAGPNSRVNTNASTALNQVLGAGPQDLTNYFNASIAAPLDKNFADSVLPAIIGQAGRSAGGAYSQDVFDNIGKATDSLEQSKASALASATTSALQSQQQNKLAGSQIAGGVSAGGMTPILAALQAGAVQQQPAQQQFSTDQNLYAQLLQYMLANTSQAEQFGTAGTMNQVVQPGQTGFIPGMASGLAGNQGLGNALGKYLFA